MKTKEEILREYIDGCRCDEAYKNRNLTDETCFWCNNSLDVISAMQEYAESYSSELRKENEGLKKENVDLRMANEHYNKGWLNYLDKDKEFRDYVRETKKQLDDLRAERGKEAVEFAEWADNEDWEYWQIEGSWYRTEYDGNVPTQETLSSDQLYDRWQQSIKQSQS
jgi:hypothetical protein